MCECKGVDIEEIIIHPVHDRDLVQEEDREFAMNE